MPATFIWNTSSHTDDDRVVVMATSSAYTPNSTDVNTWPHYAGKEDDRNGLMAEKDDSADRIEYLRL